jgi:hypothetical protein
MDKRDAVRVPVELAARCRLSAHGNFVAGLVEDVSRSGLFLRVDSADIEAGTDGELDLDLPGEETLHLHVRIVRVEDQPRAGVALKFSGDPLRARAPLANFIMKHHQSGY